MIKKKITFFSLHIFDEESGEMQPVNILHGALEWFVQLSKEEKVYDLTSSKFCYLEEDIEMKRQKEGKGSILILKSATNNYRPDLIDRRTLTERTNPKLSTEGEGEKNHVAIKFTKEETYLVMEVNGKGLTFKNLILYLRHILKVWIEKESLDANYQIEFTILGNDNFLEEIKSLKRVVASTVFVEKQVLGSEALKFSERTDEVAHDIEITIKAKRRNSILRTISDVFSKLGKQNSKISKIKVKGKNKDNNNVVLDTSFIEKVEHIDLNVPDVTGLAYKNAIVEKLTDICREL